MIPPLDEDGLLPAGVHECSWAELEARFATTKRRQTLLAGLKRALISLKQAGCGRAYVDGSFVTDKTVPGDFDGCWDPVGVELSKVDPVLLLYANKRAQQKAKYGGEMFVASEDANPPHRKTYLEFFQETRAGNPKGILALDLEKEFS